MPRPDRRQGQSLVPSLFLRAVPAAAAFVAASGAVGGVTLQGVAWAKVVDGQTYHGVDVFATFGSPLNRLLSVFNTSVQLNAAGTFFNLPNVGDFVSAKPTIFDPQELEDIDTFVAIGGSQLQDSGFFFFDPSCPQDAFVGSSGESTSGGWYNSPPTNGIQTAGPDLRVRVARFVITDNAYFPGASVSCAWTVGWEPSFPEGAAFANPSGTFYFTDELGAPPIDEPGESYDFEGNGGYDGNSGTPVTVPPAPLGSLAGKEVIWTSPGGWVVGWHLNGPALEVAESITDGQPLNTVVAAAADLDGDGDRDLVWRNPTTQQLIGCIVTDGVVTQSGPIAAPGAPVAAWQFLGAIDMNNDGRADMVWRKSDGGIGQVRVWQMNGLTREANVQIGLSPGFEFLALTDLNNDGKGDIVWRLSSGTLVAWMGQGLSAPKVKNLKFCPTMPGASWEFLAAGDLDGDGDGDLLWRNKQTLAVEGWLMQGVKRVGSGVIAQSFSPMWQLADMADVDNDGDDDIVWRNTLYDGVKVWQMQGLVKEAAAQVTSVGSGWAVLR
ncbi:MAG: VCBS repeat-containing protein [Phycisphaerales bacterium]